MKIRKFEKYCDWVEDGKHAMVYICKGEGMKWCHGTGEENTTVV